MAKRKIKSASSVVIPKELEGSWLLVAVDDDASPGYGTITEPGGVPLVKWIAEKAYVAVTQDGKFAKHWAGGHNWTPV